MSGAMSFELEFERKQKKGSPKKVELLCFVASHSQFVYGKPVETCGPYPRYYMSESYLNGLIIARCFAFSRELKVKKVFYLFRLTAHFYRFIHVFQFLINNLWNFFKSESYSYSICSHWLNYWCIFQIHRRNLLHGIDCALTSSM